MVTWRLLSEEECRQTWNQRLIELPDYTVFQSFEWGEQKRLSGWEPHRFAAFSHEGRVLSLFQVLSRRLPLGLSIFWGPGGPVGDPGCWDKGLQHCIEAVLGPRQAYVRFRSHGRLTPTDAEFLESSGWCRPRHPLLSRGSLLLDLTKEEEGLLEGFSGNWRHNLRRAMKKGLAIEPWEQPDVKQIARTYRSMESFKQLTEQHSDRELHAIIGKLGQNLLLYRCLDAHGELLGLRGAAVLGSKAWDLFAATTAEGRKTYASYVLFWDLARHCKKAGVKCYDLGGIDPVRNKGVYDFKRGTGAQPMEYLGEWEWATSRWIRWVGDLAFGRKAS